jgi:hypothetical protein
MPGMRVMARLLARVMAGQTLDRPVGRSLVVCARQDAVCGRCFSRRAFVHDGVRKQARLFVRGRHCRADADRAGARSCSCGGSCSGTRSPRARHERLCVLVPAQSHSQTHMHRGAHG